MITSKIFNSLLSLIDDFWNFILTFLKWIKNHADRLKEFAPLATLASFILAFYSFQIATQARRENKETTTQTVAMIASMKANTDSISSNMKSISGATTEFKNGLQEIREVMKEQAKSFETSIATLQASIGSFNSSLQRQEDVINTLAAATEKSVNVLQQRTEILEQELSRSPKLKLIARKVDRDSSRAINVNTWIVNSGNIFSSKHTILLHVPKELHFASTGYRISNAGEDEEVWSLQQEHFIGYDKSGKVSMMTSTPEMSFKLAPSYSIKILKLPYQIFHEGGIDDKDSLVINVPK